MNCLTLPLEEIQPKHLIEFLARYEDKPWRRHSFYRAMRTFFKWFSRTRDVPNPMLDKWGNLIIEAPKTPNKILYTISPVNVLKLIAATGTVRNKALISLLADSGARRSEIAGIKMADIDLHSNLIKVMGKDRKEGFLIFGPKTKALLEAHIQESKPKDTLFGLTSSSIQTMLYRLYQKTGIPCSAHSFRRGFATELRRQGLGELDIAELGRWSSTTMVKRYTRAYTFDDAAKRYIPIVK